MPMFNDWSEAALVVSVAAVAFLAFGALLTLLADLWNRRNGR